MISSVSSPKHTAKSSFKFNEVSGFDLFYQLTFMTALASAGISRNLVFELAAGSDSVSSQYFVAINTLVDELRYDYADACQKVGDMATSKAVRTFLLRLADALRSGEPLADFLGREADVQAGNYENEYERELEGLRIWSDAFTSILISAALIVVINLVNTMIYPVGTGMILGLVGTAVMMGFFGAWVLSRAAPKETMTMPSAGGSAQQKRVLRLSKIMLPITVALAASLLLIGQSYAIVLVTVGLMLAPLGFFSVRADGSVTKKDDEIGTFLRSLGSMANSTGSTIRQALGRLDITSFPSLQEDVERLRVRLEALVSPDLCWRRFRTESGSKLIDQTIDIFFESIRLGGDPEYVGRICSTFATRTVQLRAKRRAVAATFSWLSLIMHGAVGGLMIFVVEIIGNFMGMMTSIMDGQDTDSAANASLGHFAEIDLPFLQGIVALMVVLLAVVTAIAIISSAGGYRFKILFYIAMLFVSSGLSFLIVPPVVANILSM